MFEIVPVIQFSNHDMSASIISSVSKIPLKRNDLFSRGLTLMFPSVELLPGMILSNEPGYYKEGEYGIRIENIIVVKEDKENLLKFENISWAPIDKDLIDPNILNRSELDWINDYHQKVFEKLSMFLTLEEKNWLQNVTKPL